MVTLLLNENARVDVTCTDGATPLHCLLRSVDTARHSVLVEQVQGRTTHPLQDLTMSEIEEFQKAPLQLAVTEGFDSLVQLLLDHKAPLFAVDSLGLTPVQSCTCAALKEQLVRHHVKPAEDAAAAEQAVAE
jgi:ankyrin repeat protein